MWIRGVPEGYASNVLHSTNFGRKFVLDRPDGATFSLERFDYAAGRWPQTGDAIVTGYFAGGASTSVTAKFTNRTLQTLTLDWENLTHVEINHAGGMNDAYGAVDNFVVSSGGGDDGDDGGGDTGHGAYQEMGGRVDIEAETSTGEAAGTGAAAGSAWTAFIDVSAGGGSGVAALPNSGLNVGDSTIGARRDYAINFSTPGTYYLWVRMSGANGNDDSLHVGLDGSPLTFGESATTNEAMPQANGAKRGRRSIRVKVSRLFEDGSAVAHELCEDPQKERAEFASHLDDGADARLVVLYDVGVLGALAHLV